MEIHAPEKPILTVKEAAVHLLIVTLGILIALGLEGIVEYVHHRTVVREARESMRQEIEQNRIQLDKTLQHLTNVDLKELTHGIEVMNALTAHEATDNKIQITYEPASLRSAGRATAELMGAFAYMDYKEVGRWATVYDLQQQFMTEQAAAFAEDTVAFSFFMKRDRLKTSPAQLEVGADRLRRALGAFVVVSQTGSSLRRQYDQVLSTATR